MRIIRLAALYGSLVLLVATAVSVVHRRGDMRDEQSASVEQSVTLVSSSVRSSLVRFREDVHLAAAAVSRSGGADDLALASDLTTFAPDSEACVGSTAAGCTGTNLFSLPLVGDLAAASARPLASDALSSGARSLIGIDQATQSVVIVRRISLDGDVSTVAMSVPIESLVASSMRTVIDNGNTVVELVVASRDQGEDPISPEMIDGRRSISETISVPFVDGALVVEASVDGSIGIAGDRTVRYASFLALGTVLLALAGWTFLVERRQLERRATIDELTNLVNRREFERLAEIELDIADRHRTGLCLMVVDLNGFKAINDTLGHQFGDLVLAASAQRLVDAVRDTDVVGRWGGDEFVILLPGLTDRGAVRNSAERIWGSLSGTPVVGDTSMTGSIGAAIFPRHGTSLDALMRSADVAMYEAKTTGVSHRIADTIAVAESLLGDGFGDDTPIITDQYVGPDRRHGVPAPPQPAQPTQAPQQVSPQASTASAEEFAPPTGDRSSIS